LRRGNTFRMLDWSLSKRETEESWFPGNFGLKQRIRTKPPQSGPDFSASFSGCRGRMQFRFQ
jgi:hypothetical protein